MRGPYSIITFLMVSLLFSLTYSVSKYDFNVCRIQNCVSRQKSCIQDEGICLKGFSDTRKCFELCLTSDQLDNYNQCWYLCKNAIYKTNTLYNQVSNCYEQLCYLHQKKIQLILILVVGLMTLLIF